MKKLKIYLLLLLTPFIIYGVYSIRNNNSFTNTVQAFGSLTATYLGVPLGTPIFTVTNMFPGGPTQTRTVKVKNDGKNTVQIYVQSIRRGPNGQSDPKLENVLDLQIKEGNTILYSQKLSKFFDDSKNKKGIKLDNIQKGKVVNFDFKVTFPQSAGNEYQNKSVVFDITFSDGEKDPHDNRLDEKHPEEGEDDKGHNFDKNHPSQPTPIASLKPKNSPTPTPKPSHKN